MGTNRLQIRSDLPPSLHQIIVHLKAQEKPFRNAEITRQSQIGIRRNVPLSQHDLVDSTRWNMYGACQSVLAETHRIEEVIQQDFAGMRVTQQRPLVVVVDDFDMRWSLVFPNEADVPLVVDPDRTLPLPVCLECFEAITWWDTKIAQHPRLIEETKLAEYYVLNVRW